MAACLFLARIPANQQSLRIRGWSHWSVWNRNQAWFSKEWPQWKVGSRNPRIQRAARWFYLELLDVVENGTTVRRDGNGDVAEGSRSQILRGSKDTF